jgi:hypothetical protein
MSSAISRKVLTSSSTSFEELFRRNKFPKPVRVSKMSFARITSCWIQKGSTFVSDEAIRPREGVNQYNKAGTLQNIPGS